MATPTSSSYRDPDTSNAITDGNGLRQRSNSFAAPRSDVDDAIVASGLPQTIQRAPVPPQVDFTKCSFDFRDQDCNNTAKSVACLCEKYFCGRHLKRTAHHCITLHTDTSLARRRSLVIAREDSCDDFESPRGSPRGFRVQIPGSPRGSNSASLDSPRKTQSMRASPARYSATHSEIATTDAARAVSVSSNLNKSPQRTVSDSGTKPNLPAGAI